MSCHLATPDLSVPDMIDLIDRSPPGPWPSDWATWDNVKEAHQQMARRCADRIASASYPHERGIVIAGGGLKYFPSVWVGVHMIRHLGCRLPIQVWHLGQVECDPVMRRMLQPLGVEFIDARNIETEFPCRILCGWELKPYAVLHAPFREVLFLDADCAPVLDPTYVFDLPEYRNSGAVFWPDYACWDLKPDVWDIFGLERRQEPAFESGQFLIDKGRCFRELCLALWYAEHSDFTFRHVYGDKEAFHLGWRLAGTDYAMPAQRPGWNVHTIVQFDFRNQVLFQHRCQDKWKLAGGNRKVATLANEERCFELVADLRRRWCGILWYNAEPSPDEERIMAQLAGKTFLYRRVGHDERPLTLLAGRIIGRGAAECETRWDVFHDRDGPLLALCRTDRPTCLLRQGDDGVWRGQWLEYERMPVELLPATERNVA